jgi:hypothetical protein
MDARDLLKVIKDFLEEDKAYIKQREAGGASAPAPSAPHAGTAPASPRSQSTGRKPVATVNHWVAGYSLPLVAGVVLDHVLNHRLMVDSSAPLPPVDLEEEAANPTHGVSQPALLQFLRYEAKLRVENKLRCGYTRLLTMMPWLGLSQGGASPAAGTHCVSMPCSAG